MTSKSVVSLVAAMTALTFACGPQYAPKAGSADTGTAAQERGKERRISLDDVPQPVKKTILTEMGDRRISKIEEVLFTDRTEYEAEWKVDGEEVELHIATDGTILGRTTGDDDIDDSDEKADDHDEDDDEDEADTR